MIHEILAQYPLPPIQTKAQLVRHLQFCHSLMIATDPLLDLAGMEEKRDEEKGHADWLKQDLAALGIPTIPYDFTAAAIAGAQYYFIQHLDPRVLLGYCAVLECRTFTTAQVDAMEAIVGPLPCVRFHAEHDMQHGAEVLRQIDEIKNETVKGWIYRNAADTAAAITSITRIRLAQECAHDRSTDGHDQSGDADSRSRASADGDGPASAHRDGVTDAARTATARHWHIGRA